MTVEASSQVRLANRIAAQFHHLAAEDAAEQIAAHIAKFWDARMISDLQRRVSDDAEALDPLVVAAVALIEPRAS